MRNSQAARGASEATMSLSFPVGSTSLEDKYSKLPDAFQVSSQREMMINSSPLSSGAGSTGNIFPSSPRFPNPPLVSQPNGGRTLVPPVHSTLPESQSTAFIDSVEESKDVSWCQDSLQDLLDFPVMEPIQIDPVEDATVALASANHSEKSDWTDWDPLISIGDDLDQCWPDLPVSGNGNAMDSKPEVIKQPNNSVFQQHQNYDNQPAQSGEVCTVPDPSSAAQPTKSRMRWTQELHEAFVEAVGKLGGSERATPKGILTLMKVPSLTIYHVKSHLQKYRTARFKPELSEGVSETKSTPCEEVKPEEVKTSMGITEALRLQVELQKRLHEQLETQRKLQLQIEEQAKYLQKMFEQHKNMGNNLKASSSNTDEPCSPSSNSTTPKSARNGATGIDATNNAGSIVDESSRDSSTKQKAQETSSLGNPDSCNGESDSPPMKRPKSG